MATIAARPMISIHAPHEGERLYTRVDGWLCPNFNPRSPRGGATRGRRRNCKRKSNFNPRSPRGGATRGYRRTICASAFQSTLPTRGSDPMGPTTSQIWRIFQSTLPTRGSDYLGFAGLPSRAHFNPRSPRGGATQAPRHKGRGQLFQSTLPTRGSDATVQKSQSARTHFNPRSPRGGATALTQANNKRLPISIHAPHEGERRRKSAFVCSISANLLNIIHCGTVTRAVSRRRIALFRLFSVRRSDVFMYAYASH